VSRYYIARPSVSSSVAGAAAAGILFFAISLFTPHAERCMNTLMDLGRSMSARFMIFEPETRREAAERQSPFQTKTSPSYAANRAQKIG
jgi:hypothetical protein